jgi:hypothetical protein
MTGNAKVEINADTFSEGNSYFVRTEINARSVGVHGPFTDMESAQRMKADYLGSSKQTSAALEEQLVRAMSTLATGRR